MHRLKYLVLVISFLSVVRSDGQADKKSKIACDVTKAEALTGCPQGARCIENGTSNGFCYCPKLTVFNENFDANNKDSKYCIDETHPTDEEKVTTTSTAAPTPPPTKATQVSTSSTLSTKTSTVKPPETTPAKVEPITTTTTTTTTQKSTSTRKPDDVKVVPAPHHVLGGIFLPMFLVLGFIGLVFAVKKYELVERVHGFIRNRNQRERYSGLNENDFDDDPLLI